MGSFKHSWSDFSGGYYVGQLDNKQPSNTYTGYNVATAISDGAVVAVDTPRKVKFSASGSPSWITASGTIQVGVNGPAWISSPVMCNNCAVFSSIEWDSTASNYKAYVYVASCTDINAGTNAVTVYRSAAINPAIGTNNVVCVSTDPICVPLSDSSFDVYAAFYTNTVYRFRVTGVPNSVAIAAGVAISTNVPAGGRIVDLTFWGSRMIATVGQSDTIYFSDVASSQIYSTWTSTNFIAPGASSDVVISVVPRQDELWVIKPTGIYVITGVLGSTSFVRRYKQTSAVGNVWTHSVAEYNNQIYTIPTEPPGRLMQLVGTREIANYSYFGDLASTVPKVVNGFLSYGALGTAYPTLSTTQNDQLAFCYLDNASLWSSGINGATNCNIFTLDNQGTWIRRLVPVRTDVFATTSKSYVFVCAKTNSYLDDYSYGYPSSTYLPTRYNRTFIYYFQLTRSQTPSYTNAIEASLSFFSILPNAAGFDFTSATAYSDFSTGVLTTSQIQTEKPTKITRVYVEAEFNPTLGTVESQSVPSSISPTMSVVVNNLAVNDVSFDSTKTYSSVAKSYTGPTIATFGSTNNQTRILRFDSNDTGYGYKHNVNITFKGFRIKAIWAEGETQ